MSGVSKVLVSVWKLLIKRPSHSYTNLAVGTLRVFCVFSDRWAFPREDDAADEFTSHYDRMAGSRDQYDVFSSQLPGTLNLVVPTSHMRASDASGSHRLQELMYAWLG